MLIVFTGNGKGKTSAAVGQSMRMAGVGKKTLMVKFIKGPWISGEDVACDRLSPYFKIRKVGKGFVGIQGDTLTREDHAEAAAEGMEYARSEARSGNWHMIVLDELLNAMKLDLIGFEAAMKLIDDIAPYVEHVIVTGRDCPEELVEKADLVTYMREVKHPFAKGGKAVRGIEY
ncbi:MAG: cob(I)yrinic acid a,c-diamide adenosyltransferase [Candidatus Taylorbacteria bacterium]|nr:cob(I)yrinic acid a,c-diamide adenosyltransferase [Candidatus Taylorbacteria bacterium]